MADATGALYDGDQLLYVIARDYQRRGVLTGGVVGTLMSNLGFEQALARMGIRARCARRSATATCSSNCCERGWQLGGENSGPSDLPRQAHDRRRHRRRARRAARADRAAARRSRRRREPVTLFPQRLINVPVQRGWDWHGSDGGRRPRSAWRSTRSATPVACCCGRPAPSRCCASWSRRASARWPTRTRRRSRTRSPRRPDRRSSTCAHQRAPPANAARRRRL